MAYIEKPNVGNYLRVFKESFSIYINYTKLIMTYHVGHLPSAVRWKSKFEIILIQFKSTLL